MYLHMSVSHSVPQGGGCLPQCMLGYTSPPGQTSPRQTSPQADIPPLGRHNPWEDTPLGRHPLGRHPPLQTATAGDGTHPTGMHTCSQKRMHAIIWLLLFHSLYPELKLLHPGEGF